MCKRTALKKKKREKNHTPSSKESDVTPRPSYIFFVFEIKTSWTLIAKLGETLFFPSFPLGMKDIIFCF